MKDNDEAWHLLVEGTNFQVAVYDVTGKSVFVFAGWILVCRRSVIGLPKSPVLLLEACFCVRC